MKDIFNKLLLSKAVEMIKYDPENAEEALRDYLEKYPLDYSGYTHYAHALVVLGKGLEALNILSYVEKISKQDSKFYLLSDKVNYLQKQIIINKYRALAQLERYEELYDYYNKTKHIVDESFTRIKIKCEKELGTLDLPRENQRYLFRQIKEYSEEDFKDHIKKHLSDFNEKLEIPNESIFSYDFPIDDVIEEVKKYIPSDKKLCTGVTEDTYYFKYNDCGRENNRITDYFSLVTLHNTSNIITLFPMTKSEKCPYVDLNYLNRSKVKTLSQIEKFNLRYKKKSI